jgi:hypothetical protein
MSKRVFNFNANEGLKENKLHGRDRTGVKKERAEIQEPVHEGTMSAEQFYRERQMTESQFYSPPEEGWDRVALIFGRHGDTPKDEKTGGSLDELLKPSHTSMFRKGQQERIRIFGDNPIHPEETLSVVSPKKRTRQTTQAFMAGFTSGKDAYVPQSEREIHEKHGRKLERIPVIVRPEFDYERRENGELVQDANPHAYKLKDGPEQILNHWIRNPHSIEHTVEGKTARIKPFYQIYGEMKNVVAGSIATLMDPSSNIKVIDARTHGTKEEVIRKMVADAAGIDVKDIKDIGGLVEKEGYDILVIDINRKTGMYRATAKIGKKIVPGVDLRKLGDPNYNPHLPPHLAGQQVSYDMNHEPSQKELAEMQMQQREYLANPHQRAEHEKAYQNQTSASRLHEPHPEDENIPANRYERYGKQQRRPVNEERRYANK